MVATKKQINKITQPLYKLAIEMLAIPKDDKLVKLADIDLKELTCK